jgi:hypothetical protein
VKELFEDVDAVHDDLSTTQSEVADLARRISNRIDRIVAVNNKVTFVLDRDVAVQVRELAELEGISLDQMCSVIITESLSD